MKTKNLKSVKSLTFLTLLLGSIVYCQENKSSSYTIAYGSKESGDMEIYLTDSEGKEKFKLTNRKGRDGYVAWSPDGKRVAMYAYHDGGNTWSIHTMNIDGTNRQRLTYAKDKWDSSPTWSPDGKKIAFARAYANVKGAWQEEI
ncbi:TolB family protein [Tenacibaculum sp.]|uniref:TolB family protein n=1 Tax=Tenacibaculum sp. TaxID=1906242 RepID=UPI003D12A4F7